MCGARAVSWADATSHTGCSACDGLPAPFAWDRKVN